MRFVSLALVALLLVPATAAEFGREDAGFPVNVDGDVVYPYVPQDWYERHGDLVDDLLSGGTAGDPLNKVNGYTLFPYYPLLTAELKRLAADHPDKVRLTSAGKSHAGLDLWLLEIADFSNPDKVPLEEREVIYLDGGTHSNEYSGVYFVTEWVQFILDEYETNETARWIVENRHTWVMPMVNPDGSNAFGRLNAITVNVNRNFPSTWGQVASDQPPLNWPGPYAGSEPETQAVVQVMDAVKPDFVQSTHCCGNLWLHPYGAEHLGHAPDFDMFTNICVNVFPDLTVNVDRVRCGETWSTIYPASGTTLDEGYGRSGASSWSYEMSGRGAIAPWGQPVIDADPREQETESWRGVMHGMLHAEKYGGLPVVTELSGSGDQLLVTVENQGYGNLTRTTLTVAGQSVAVDDLLPGQSATYAVAGSFQDGTSVPVELEWKKRYHPESNWGQTRFHAPLGKVGSALVGLLPERPEAPDMGGLLPEVPANATLPQGGPHDVAGPGLEGDAKSTPGLLPGLSVLALAAVAVLVRRR